MYPLVEASGGQDQYYLRSSWHSEECNWKCSGQSDVPTSRDIWSSRAVLHKFSLTFTAIHQVSLTFWGCRHTPLETSGGQKQYYVRSVWHLQTCIRLAWHFADADIPPIQASGDQDQYYLRSSWHSEEANWKCSGQSEVPLSRGIWWSREVLHKFSLTFTVIHQVSLTFCRLQQTIFRSMCSLQYTILSCQEYVYSGKMIDPPLRTSTYERPFTQEGNYLVTLLQYSKYWMRTISWALHIT